MIDSINGILTHIYDNYVIVDVNGFGIRIQSTTSIISLLKNKIGKKVFFLTKMIVRDDLIEIFGFNSHEDLSLFIRLNTISGIGPKSAINMIDRLGTPNIIDAIASQNTSFISSAPGIGTKTAKRIIIELEKHFANHQIEVDLQMQQAIAAISNMGHCKNEAFEMVSNAKKRLKNSYTTQDLIKEALKALI